MHDQLSADDRRRLDRWRYAYDISGRSEFASFGVRGVIRLCWLRWLWQRGALTEWPCAEGSPRSRLARRAVRLLESYWHSDCLS